MKYCKKCELNIDKNVDYCGDCGTKLTDIDMSPTTAISPNFKHEYLHFKRKNNEYPDFYKNEYNFETVRKFKEKQKNQKLKNKEKILTFRWCADCLKSFNTENLVQCGPCGKYFCESCWVNHQWRHGKPSEIGISYQSDGSFSGFDGSERFK